MTPITKDDLSDALDTIAEAFDSGSSENIRRLSWRLNEEANAERATPENNGLPTLNEMLAADGHISKEEPQ